MRASLRAGIALLYIGIAGCTLHSARDDLGALMQREVGKSLDDPGSYRAGHPRLRIGARTLSNGNSEEEFRAGFRDACPVFFEVDRSSGKVVSWRFGQPDDNCIFAAPLAPPADRK
jgi:hypothetical protein